LASRKLLTALPAEMRDRNPSMETVLQAFKDFLDILASKIVPVSSDASAVILVVIVIGFLVLFAYIATLKIKQSGQLQTIGSDGQKDPIKLREELDACREEISELRTNPPYWLSEKLYFALNGIVNSGFILSVALTVWEFFRLRPLKLPVSKELGYVVIALASTMLVSGIIILLTRHDYGRAYARINRAFMISFVIAVAAFLTFVYVTPHPV
jgi:hypothetical protein